MEVPIKHVQLIVTCLLEMKLRISQEDAIITLNQVTHNLVLSMNVHNGRQENGQRLVYIICT